MNRPPPVVWTAIEPRTPADREKIEAGLRILQAEDPTFRVNTDRQTRELIISGLGERHLEIIVDRLRLEFGADVSAGAPQIAYKEALTRGADGEYGHVRLHLSPGEPGRGYVFDNHTDETAIPAEFIEAVEAGTRDACASGGPAGYPIDDVQVDLLDGSHHDLDSSHAAFKIAGAMAFRDALQHARPIVLEPVMRAELHVPSEHLRDLMSTLADRDAQILSEDERDRIHSVVARVPMARLLGFAAELRAGTAGRGSFSMTFDRYEPRRADRV